MSEQEYDPQQLDALVEAALSTTDEAATATFDYGHTRIFETLYPTLKDYLHPADLTAVMDKLREDLDNVASEKSATERLRDLHAIQKSCRVCEGVEPDPKLPYWNKTDPDLLIVTDQPLELTAGANLLIDSLKEAGFHSARLCATALVRCPVKGKKIESEHVSNCIKRYLFTEIPLLAPKLILACGSLSSSTLAARPVKITEEMGSIVWVGPWPIMLTASPGYAMHSDGKKDEFFSNIKKAYHFLYG